MELSDLLTSDGVVAGLAVADKAALLAELGRRAGALLRLPPGPITEALQAREQLGSTGLGKGFALPHARLEPLGRFLGMFVRLARLIAFDAIDDQPVGSVFLLLTPAAATPAEHLAALAAISRRMSDPEVVRRIAAAASPAQIFAVLVGTNGQRAA